MVRKKSTNRHRLVPVALGAAGAATFLHSTSLPVVKSPLLPESTLRLVLWDVPLIDAFVLGALIPLAVVGAAVPAIDRMATAPRSGAGVARGLLMEAGLVATASVVGLTGFLIEAKRSSIAFGAVVGVAGASLMVAAAVAARESQSERSVRDDAQVRRSAGALALLIGGTLMAAAFLMPETTFYSRGIWPTRNAYWEWAILVPATIVVPVLISSLRILFLSGHGSVSTGVALAGAIFGTLVFVQDIGQALQNNDPRVKPAPGLYLGVMAGAMMLVGALGSLNRTRAPSTSVEGSREV